MQKHTQRRRLCQCCNAQGMFINFIAYFESDQFIYRHVFIIQNKLHGKTYSQYK